MDMKDDIKRTGVRILFVGIILVSSLILTQSYLAYNETGTPSQINRQTDIPRDERQPIVEPRNNITVVTGQGAPAAVGGGGQLVAFDSDGSVLYINTTLDNYADVDPSPVGSSTVMYVGAIWTNRSCNVQRGIKTNCRRNVVERVNLTTGTVTRLYTRMTGPGTWHDVDRIDDSRLLVGDILNDRVFIVNTSTGIIEWSWNAQNKYSINDGGPYPSDWTHLNDVEYLSDGRIMTNVRNMNNIVFIDRNYGVIENWTLGEIDDPSVHERSHNPDYIPKNVGGPAILIADSGNDRIIEYQRMGGEWKQTWVWKDEETFWPRDADRLPNGNTLITISNDNRVVEVNESGSIVWSASIDKPYEAERIGTGDESKNGPSAGSANLTSTGATDELRDEEFVGILEKFRKVERLLPPQLVNALLFFRPPWVRFKELYLIIVLVLSVVIWGGVEFRWSSLGFQSPITKRE